jgi:hypothetical protein
VLFGSTAMQQTQTTRAFLRRLRPWVGKAVHARWATRRSLYQSEIDALLLALAGPPRRLPPELHLRVEGFLGRLHREWFPPTWRQDPTYDDVVADLRWWLGVAERWNEPIPKRPRRRRRTGALAEQPEKLCRMLGVAPDCTAAEFAAAWRAFLKRNHPDLNPDQTREERQWFATAMALRRR